MINTPCSYFPTVGQKSEQQVTTKTITQQKNKMHRRIIACSQPSVNTPTPCGCNVHSPFPKTPSTADIKKDSTAWNSGNSNGGGNECQNCSTTGSLKDLQLFSWYPGMCWCAVLHCLFDWEWNRVIHWFIHSFIHSFNSSQLIDYPLIDLYVPD